MRRWTSDELQRINVLKGVLISPGSYPSFGEWQDDFTQRMVSLLRIDTGISILVTGAGPPRFATGGIRFEEIQNPSAFLEENEGNRRLRERGLTLWTKEEVVNGEWGRYRDSAEYQELFLPNRFMDGAGFVSATRNGDFGVLALFSQHEEVLSRSESLRQFLNELAPEWRAGLEATSLLRSMVDFIIGSADVAGTTALLFEADGRLIRMSEVAEDMLVRVPEGPELLEHARELARDLARGPGDYHPCKSNACGEIPVRAESWVRPGAVLHRLLASFVELPGSLRRQVLVVIDPWSRIPLTDKELEHDYGIPARVRETALHFAAGLSDAEIARELGLREGSVKKNLDALREWFDVHTRRELLAILNGERRDHPPPARHRRRGRTWHHPHRRPRR